MATYGAFEAGGANFNSVPSAQKHTLAGNYVDLRAAGWTQQYLPDLMDKEAEVFGNRTVGGFLEMVGAAEPMSSDQVVWSEQGRLHLSYQGNCTHATGATYVFQIVKDIDGNVLTAATGKAYANHGVRVGDLVLITDADASVKGYVTAVDTQSNGGSGDVYAAIVTVSALTDGGTGIGTVAASVTNVTCGLMVFGSSYGKGTNGRANGNQPGFKSFSNRPLIMKDKYEVSGSDASQIGWIEVSGEDGQAGYMWYLKAAGDTRQRFADYLEMTMLEAEKATNAITGEHSATIEGSEGLFAAMADRGNIYNGINNADATAAADNLLDFDDIIAKFDTQGAIEEYMMFLNRNTSLKIDDMLAGMNSYGAGGTSYGVFNNEEDMALNLGFSGFRRGSYDFYKSDFRYLNDLATRGGINAKAGANAIRGVIVPAGTSTVYDQQLGKNLKRPFLHVRYRASATDNRKIKTWTTGSVGAATSALDAMQIHILSERCLVVQGANNFMLMQ